MEQKILIAYASGAGSTAEIAQFIAEQFGQQGVHVEVQPAEVVTDIGAYSAVMLGSSIRFGRWLLPAISFLEAFSESLAGMPVAFFMTCLAVVSGAEDAQGTALSYWDPILKLVPALEPAGLGLFAGSIAPELARLQEYQGGPYGDYRDWESIRSWALEMLPSLLAGQPRTTQPLVLSGTVLSYTDLSGADLSHFDFRKSEFVQARLREATLRQTDFRGANLQGADLRGADMQAARLGWAEMEAARCQEADFSEASMIGVNLKNARMMGAKMPRAVLNGAILNRADLSGANLSQADMNWADLAGCSLSGADLRHASLGWANLSDTDLEDADLSGARYNAHTRWPADFSPEQAGCIQVKFLPA